MNTAGDPDTGHATGVTDGCRQSDQGESHLCDACTQRVTTGRISSK